MNLSTEQEEEGEGRKEEGRRRKEGKEGRTTTRGTNI
jgi:hypothetical protein